MKDIASFSLITMVKSYQSFRDKLEKEHTWPSEYMFKFIVPKEKEKELTILFPTLDFSLKKSSGGNYISFTARVVIEMTDQVIKIYEKADKIEGLIAL
jgi:putative lipoic acid-binding regulatory protein